jgi:hypothetical protein
MPVRVALARVNRSVRELPKACAPTAIARATNTINMAYSVAVAPLSSRQKRLVRLCMLTSSFRGVTLWQCAPEAITVATQPVARLTQSLSVVCQVAVRKAPFVIYFIRLYAMGTPAGCGEYAAGEMRSLNVSWRLL